MRRIYLTLLLCITSIILVSAITVSNAFSEDKAAAPAPVEAAKEAPKKAPAQEDGNAGKMASVNNFNVSETGLRAGDIYNSCKNYFSSEINNKENVAKRGTCNGYFFGVASTLLTLNMAMFDTNVCLPRTITTHQTIQAFLEWAQKEGTDLKVLATEGTMEALKKKYPCY